MTTWRLPLLCALLLGSNPAISAEQSHEPWTAICTQTKGFHDGDTLTCVSDPADQGTFIVRFAGIDAPETGQAFWRASRDLLRKLAVPGTVASCYKQDRYGREVCRLHSAQGDDLAEAMLKNGLAWHAVKYAHEETETKSRLYGESEAAAKASWTGLWSEPNPQPPWECRKQRKRHFRCN